MSDELTDEHLAAIEFANAATVGFPSATVERLLAEVRRLRAQVKAQADLLAVCRQIDLTDPELDYALGTDLFAAFRAAMAKAE